MSTEHLMTCSTCLKEIPRDSPILMEFYDDPPGDAKISEHFTGRAYHPACLGVAR